MQWAREGVERGAGEILLTSMDRDGTNAGYDLALTSAVAGAVGVPVIASGGAGALEHLSDAIERRRGCRALRVDLPLRPAHGGRGQGALARDGIAVRARLTLIGAHARSQTVIGLMELAGCTELRAPRLRGLFHVSGGGARIAIRGRRNAGLITARAAAGRRPLGPAPTDAGCSGILELFAHAIELRRVLRAEPTALAWPAPDNDFHYDNA